MGKPRTPKIVAQMVGRYVAYLEQHPVDLTAIEENPLKEPATEHMAEEQEAQERHTQDERARQEQERRAREERERQEAREREALQRQLAEKLRRLEEQRRRTAEIQSYKQRGLTSVFGRNLAMIQRQYGDHWGVQMLLAHQELDCVPLLRLMMDEAGAAGERLHEIVCLADEMRNGTPALASGVQDVYEVDYRKYDVDADFVKKESFWFGLGGWDNDGRFVGTRPVSSHGMYYVASKTKKGWFSSETKYWTDCLGIEEFLHLEFVVKEEGGKSGIILRTGDHHFQVTEGIVEKAAGILLREMFLVVALKKMYQVVCDPKEVAAVARVYRAIAEGTDVPPDEPRQEAERKQNEARMTEEKPAQEHGRQQGQRRHEENQARPAATAKPHSIFGHYHEEVTTAYAGHLALQMLLEHPELDLIPLLRQMLDASGAAGEAVKKVVCLGDEIHGGVSLAAAGIRGSFQSRGVDYAFLEREHLLFATGAWSGESFIGMVAVTEDALYRIKMAEVKKGWFSTKIRYETERFVNYAFLRLTCRTEDMDPETGMRGPYVELRTVAAMFACAPGALDAAAEQLLAEMFLLVGLKKIYQEVTDPEKIKRIAADARA